MTAWVGGAGNYRTTSGALTVSLPTFNAGDLAVLVVGNDSGTDPAYATPAGWTFRAKTVASNMFSYIFTRALQAGDTAVTVTITTTGTAAVGIWRDAVWNSIGTFGIRSGSVTTITAPDHPTATGARAHIFSDRTVYQGTGDEDVLPTSLTYGTGRYAYGGNMTISASTGICAVYFIDSQTGSGANTAILADLSSNAWGVQVDIQGMGVLHTRSVSDTVAVVGLPPTVVNTVGAVAHTRPVADTTGVTDSLQVSRNLYQPGDRVRVTDPLRLTRNRYQPGDSVAVVGLPPAVVKRVISTHNRTISEDAAVGPDALNVIRHYYRPGDTVTVTDPGQATRTVETLPDLMTVVGDPLPVKVVGSSAVGRPKAYVDGAWRSQPARVYIGGSWVDRSWKRWDGSKWVPIK